MIYIKLFENFSNLISHIDWTEYYDFHKNHKLERFTKSDYKIVKNSIESAYDKLEIPYRMNIGSAPSLEYKYGTRSPVGVMDMMVGGYDDKVRMEFPNEQNPLVVLSYTTFVMGKQVMGKQFIDIEIEKYEDDWYILHIHSQEYKIFKCDSLDSIGLLSDVIINSYSE